jgi:hypothetical protein
MTSRPMTAALSVILFGAAACADGPTTPTTTARIVALVPTGGATGVDPAAPIVITFSHAMPAGIEQYVALHQGALDGPVVPMTCGWSADRATLTCVAGAACSAARRSPGRGCATRWAAAGLRAVHRQMASGRPGDGGTRAGAGTRDGWQDDGRLVDDGARLAAPQRHVRHGVHLRPREALPGAPDHMVMMERQTSGRDGQTIPTDSRRDGAVWLMLAGSRVLRHPSVARVPAAAAGGRRRGAGTGALPPRAVRSLRRHARLSRHAARDAGRCRGGPPVRRSRGGPRDTRADAARPTGARPADSTSEQLILHVSTSGLA